MTININVNGYNNVMVKTLKLTVIDVPISVIKTKIVVLKDLSVGRSSE